MRTFASDNTAPVAPEILEAIARANEGDAVSYGDDPYTERATERLRQIFGADVDPYFVFNGTGANVVALSSLLKPYEAVITPASAHLQTDECGAFERFAGSKVLPVNTPDGKLRIADLQPYAGKLPDEHHSTPRAISISQSTEYGTLYTLPEIRALCEFAHGQGWYVHMDGARIANAAVALGAQLRECTRDQGVDVLSFGGTKNGLLFGEAIVFFDAALHAGAARFVRKQAMQLGFEDALRCRSISRAARGGTLATLRGARQRDGAALRGARSRGPGRAHHPPRSVQRHFCDARSGAHPAAAARVVLLRVRRRTAGSTLDDAPCDASGRRRRVCANDHASNFRACGLSARARHRIS